MKKYVVGKILAKNIFQYLRSFQALHSYFMYPLILYLLVKSQIWSEIKIKLWNLRQEIL